MSAMKRNIKPFDGEKYTIWKIRIRALLAELDVIDVIEKNKSDVIDFEKKDRIAKNNIIEYLTDSFLGFVKEELTAKEVIENFDLIYARKSLTSQITIRKQLLELKFRGDTPLIEHIRIFDDLILDLITAGASVDETEKIANLLMTLPPKYYDDIITTIQMVPDDKINVLFVKNLILGDEIKIKNAYKDTIGEVSHTESKNYNEKQNKYDKNIQTGSIHKKKIKCKYCGRKGHIKSECFYYKNNKQNANIDRSRKTESMEVQESSTSTYNSNGSVFTFMISNLQQLDVKNNYNITFTLDNGALDHIINNEDCFTKFINLDPPINISIAKTDTYITATKRGIVEFTTNLGIKGILENVLYCSDVPYNLLSVTKMQQSGYSVLFDHTGTSVSKNGEVIMRSEQLADELKPVFLPTFMK